MSARKELPLYGATDMADSAGGLDKVPNKLKIITRGSCGGPREQWSQTWHRTLAISRKQRLQGSYAGDGCFSDRREPFTSGLFNGRFPKPLHLECDIPDAYPTLPGSTCLWKIFVMRPTCRPMLSSSETQSVREKLLGQRMCAQGPGWRHDITWTNSGSGRGKNPRPKLLSSQQMFKVPWQRSNKDNFGNYEKG
ncbi:uncharacterized protein CIMG_13090 [Coccidioides immitis RS]|uniref:Uncharacterized protein n=1 Tax=Coccidioides immitis (strain RS) TaxID=246410 RepID=J3K968_COCIM|nr:uncharacterized protein CIMG_13090 [Coccidioides immitis RS]EAS31420.3 hypothetical protein CIMG_13090 [Coccidioides immitis RS]